MALKMTEPATMSITIPNTTARADDIRLGLILPLRVMGWGGGTDDVSETCEYTVLTNGCQQKMSVWREGDNLFCRPSLFRQSFEGRGSLDGATCNRSTL